MADRKDELEYLQKLREMQYFNREDLLRAMNQCGMVVGEHAFRARVERLIASGKIVRVGRNAYCVSEYTENRKQKRMRQAGRALGTEVRIAVEGYTAEENSAVYEKAAAAAAARAEADKRDRTPFFRPYHYAYSRFAQEVAIRIKEHHPYVEFTVFELLQLSEFLKTPVLYNIIFISAKSDLGDFLFHTLNTMYPGRVLLRPTVQQLCQYYSDNLLVIEKQVSEAPAGKQISWHTRLEKLLVDIRTGKLLPQLLHEMGWEEQEWVSVYEKAFERYGIDESCLFRYAKRRAAENKIREFIEKETKVQLRLQTKAEENRKELG